MAAYQRFKLAAMIMLLGLLIVVARTTVSTAFPAEHFRPDQRGTFLIQDEGERPQLCFSIDAAIKKLVAADPGVKINQHTSKKDQTSVIFAEFSNGFGAMMEVESGGMVCKLQQLHPIQLLIGKEFVKAEDSKVTTVQLYPPLTS